MTDRALMYNSQCSGNCDSRLVAIDNDLPISAYRLDAPCAVAAVAGLRNRNVIFCGIFVVSLIDQNTVLLDNEYI